MQRDDLAKALSSMRRELDETKSEIERLREDSTQMLRELEAQKQLLGEATRSATEARENLNTANESLRVTQARLHEAEGRAARLQRDMKRLLSRRSVRIALALSRPLKPFFQWWRGLRKRKRNGGQTETATRIARVHESFDSRVAVRTRRSLLLRRLTKPARYDETTVSVVMPTYNRATVLPDAIESVLKQSHQNWELLVIDDGSTDGTGLIVQGYTSDPRVRYFRTENHGVSSARNHALAKATGSLVAYLDSDNTWNPDYLRLMVIKVVSDNLDCAYSAVEVVDASGATRFYRGDEFDWEECRKTNYVDINALVHRRSLADRGFETTLRRMVDWDFILRITRDAKVAFVPFLGCRYVASHEDPLRLTRTEPEVWTEVIRERHAEGGAIVPWEDVADRLKLTFALKIAAPRDRRQEWGDFHFANSLAKALETLGHSVRVDFKEDWDTGDRRDVNIVLRGLREFQPQRGAINIIWNISHPDKVSPSELSGYDIAYTASRSHARLMRLEAGEDMGLIRPLMQCTDEALFNPTLRENISPYSAEVLFVGNSRADFRPMVRWALEGELDIQVYGRGWSELVDDPRIHDTLIDNQDLGSAYATSQVVLSDHWLSMRDFGIVSNRVFDVTATGTRLISDRVPALDSLFGPIVTQVESAEDLRSAVGAPGPRANDLLELADWVITHHTFSDRARIIVDDVLAYLNLPRRYGTEPQADSTPRFGDATRPDQLKVGVTVSRGEDGPAFAARMRLIGPLSTEHACDRLEVTEVQPDAFPGDLDLLIVQSSAISGLDHAEETVQSARARGVSVVVDIAGESDTPLSAAHPVLRAAESVWFSTRALQQSQSDVPLAHSIVVPDSIDARVWRRYTRSTEHHPRGDGSRRLLLLGTGTNHDDFDLIYPALRQLARQFAFELFVIGDSAYDAPDEPWLKISSPSHEATSHRAFAQWLVEQGPFDIGLAPLCNTPSNRVRSDREFLTYSALGVLSVVSDMPPYAGIVKDRDLAVITGDDGWFVALTEIFESPWRFRAIQERAEQYVWTERTVESTSDLLLSEIENVAARRANDPSNVASSPGAS
jgi:glycosyltransferase involved in cell wall biosynthesis